MAIAALKKRPTRSQVGFLQLPRLVNNSHVPSGQQFDSASFSATLFEHYKRDNDEFAVGAKLRHAFELPRDRFSAIGSGDFLLPARCEHARKIEVSREILRDSSHAGKRLFQGLLAELSVRETERHVIVKTVL